MSQKIHPKLFRLNTIQTWDSKWFAKKRNYAATLKEDVLLREFLKEELKSASVDLISIDRNGNKLNITITSAKPGFIIGRSGSGIEELKKKIVKKFYRGVRLTINVSIKEIANPLLSANVVGQQIAGEIERRLPFRRSMKMSAERIMEAGAKGVKITVGGRLNGAEIARSETISRGSIPLHNLRADIDFARIRANTIWGVIGVRVWIYRGEVFGDSANANVIDKPKRRGRRNR